MGQYKGPAEWWKRENPLDVMEVVATWLENFANGDEYEEQECNKPAALDKAMADAQDLAERLNKACATVESYGDREEH